MATFPPFSKTRDGKKEYLNPNLTVKVRNDSKKERETTADFGFLLP
ncbi:hypothetical protein ACVWVZ_002504 [Pseudomonas tolaasii]